MPALYAFVACEKIIIDTNGVASLISLFTIVTAGVPADLTEFPPNTVVPKEWGIFVSWDWEPGDEGKEYANRIQVLNPDGTVFIEPEVIKFIMQPGRKQQINVPVLGLPISQQGNCKVRMWLELNGVTIFEARPIQLEMKHAFRPPASQLSGKP